MDEQTSTRDLIIELKVTVEHLSKKVEDAFQRNDNRLDRFENEVRTELNDFEKRIRTLERFFWLALGGLAIINIMLPFVRDWIVKTLQ